MIQKSVVESFKRCEKSGDFAEVFYSIFLASSSEIAPFFANTDFAQQRALLRASVYALVTKDVDNINTQELLRKVGLSHSKSELNIKPSLYRLWLDSVCQTVAKMDPQWDSILETSWRDQLQPGVDVITSFY